jgi:hypothetical protein
MKLKYIIIFKKLKIKSLYNIVYICNMNILLELVMIGFDIIVVE